MTKKDELSKLADDIGILFAGVLFFFSYLMVRHQSVVFFEIAFSVIMAIMFAGATYMVWLLTFRSFLSERVRNALYSSVQSSSEITPKFVLHYILVTLGYMLPVLFYPNDWIKYVCVLSMIMTVTMLIKMFSYNNYIKRER